MAPRKNNQKGGRTPLKTAAAPAIQQAPVPQALNKFGGTQRYIDNLYVPGNRDYQSQYGGGGWVATKGTPGVDAISDQELRNYNKAFAYLDKTTGGKAAIQPLGSEELINRYSGEYDKMAAQGTFGGTTSGSATASPTTKKSYKDIKSISGGLKIGGDNILGRREATRISRNTGKSYDDVITKALGQGMSIGGGAVNKSNRAYGMTGNSVAEYMSNISGPLGEMRRVTPGKRQMYSGTYELDGKTMPLIESRRGGVNPMSIGGGRGQRGGKGRNKGGGMADLGAGTSTGTGMGVQPMADYQPMTPEDMQQASTVEGFGALSGGGAGVGGATKLGRAKSRLRQLGIYGRGTSLLGRGLQYGNTLNA